MASDTLDLWLVQAEIIRRIGSYRAIARVALTGDEEMKSKTKTNFRQWKRRLHT
jgi:hypothetical protein